MSDSAIGTGKEELTLANTAKPNRRSKKRMRWEEGSQRGIVQAETQAGAGLPAVEHVSSFRHLFSFGEKENSVREEEATWFHRECLGANLSWGSWVDDYYY